MPEYSLIGNSDVLVLLMQVDAKLRLPVVLNKFLQPITLTPEEFFPQWKALTVHSLKVQEVVRPRKGWHGGGGGRLLNDVETEILSL